MGTQTDRCPSLCLFEPIFSPNLGYICVWTNKQRMHVVSFLCPHLAGIEVGTPPPHHTPPHPHLPICLSFGPLRHHAASASVIPADAATNRGRSTAGVVREVHNSPATARPRPQRVRPFARHGCEVRWILWMSFFTIVSFVHHRLRTHPTMTMILWLLQFSSITTLRISDQGLRSHAL